jgi:hypothetical protein
MPFFVPNAAVENVRALAQSALPDAPVVADDCRPPHRITRLVRALLRSLERRRGRTVTNASIPLHRPGGLDEAIPASSRHTNPRELVDACGHRSGS